MADDSPRLRDEKAEDSQLKRLQIDRFVAQPHDPSNQVDLDGSPPYGAALFVIVAAGHANLALPRKEL